MEMAPACPQSFIYYPPVGSHDENCLFLNVFTSIGAHPGDERPVMVYLHGGAFTNGAANEDRLNASYTVAQEPRLVVVVVQYRLGVLGFSSGRALGGARSGNFGIQDQRAALQWVQRSIHAFGGARDRVLLAGQSAGAGSVSVHLVAARSAGLFSRALMLSGAFGHWITQQRDAAEAQLEHLARAVGCMQPPPGTHDIRIGAGLSGETVNASCLRSRDAMWLVNASIAMPFGPTVGTDELPLEPWALARRGALAQNVQLMLGSTAEDGTSPKAVGGASASGATLRAWIEDYFRPNGPLNLSSAQVANLSRAYATAAALNWTRVPDARRPPAYWSSIRLLADSEMACPARRVARQTALAMGSTSAHTSGHAAAYWYLWAHSPLVGSSGGMRCAYHSSELPFLFHVLEAKDRQYQLNSEEERALSSDFLGYVASFAATGTPRPRNAGTPAWTAFDGQQQSRLLLRAAGAEGGSRIESRGTNATSLYLLQQWACDVWDMIPDTKEPLIN
jgi:para-nitrobenzyl esterase